MRYGFGLGNPCAQVPELHQSVVSCRASPGSYHHPSSAVSRESSPQRFVRWKTTQGPTTIKRKQFVGKCSTGIDFCRENETEKAAVARVI